MVFLLTQHINELVAVSILVVVLTGITPSLSIYREVLCETQFVDREDASKYYSIHVCLHHIITRKAMHYIKWRACRRDHKLTAALVVIDYSIYAAFSKGHAIRSN